MLRVPVAPSLTLVLALVLSFAVAPGASAGTNPTGAVPGPHGTPGIGDRYFPLDGNGGIDVLHYAVHDRYDFGTGRLTGRTRLTIRAEQRLTRFHLDLLLPVRSVRVNGRPAAWGKPNRHELRIRPRVPLRAGRTVSVVVRYAGVPGRLRYAGGRSWLADRHEVVTMGQPHMAPWWFPANDHPRDKARMDIHITLPRSKRVVANGDLVGRRVHGRLATTHWRAKEPMAPYLAFFAAGRFAVAKGRRGGLPWLVAVSKELPPEQRRRAMRLMRRTPAVTAWAERLLGEYPFSSTGGLTTSLRAGFALENQTRPTYPVMTGGGALSTVVHEIAHQWFGNSVSVLNWRDIWLNEGAATWVELYWDESHGGPSVQTWLRRAHRGWADERDFWRVRLDHPGPNRLFDAAIYLRGAMTFQALRHRIGDADFRRLLRIWLTARRGGHGTTSQFRALAEQVSGENLDAFFQAWLRDARPPARTADNGF